MLEQHIRTGSQQRNLYDQQHWEEHLEIPVLCLVMEHLNAQHAAQSSKARRHLKQRLFQYTPLPLTGASFVMSHQGKGSDVHNRYDGQRREYNRLLIRNSIQP